MQLNDTVMEYLEELKWSVIEVVPAENAGDVESKKASLSLLADDLKWQEIMKFMAEFGYHQTFRNEKFAIYR